MHAPLHKLSLKITKFDTDMTNQNFSHEYGYFDTVCINAGNTFITSTLRGYWL